ncbi:MAG: hypothetical protein U1F77_00210 [Kiritimatiellia bacterium]
MNIGPTTAGQNTFFALPFSTTTSAQEYCFPGVESPWNWGTYQTTSFSPARPSGLSPMNWSGPWR